MNDLSHRDFGTRAFIRVPEVVALLYAGNTEPQLGIDRPAEPGLGAPSSLFVYLATHAL
jgi:hypothetical protein